MDALRAAGMKGDALATEIARAMSIPLGIARQLVLFADGNDASDVVDLSA